MVRESDKTLEEFLKALINLTKANIDFLKGKELKNPIPLCDKYFEELQKIGNFINSEIKFNG